MARDADNDGFTNEKLTGGNRSPRRPPRLRVRVVGAGPGSKQHNVTGTPLYNPRGSGNPSIVMTPMSGGKVKLSRSRLYKL